jgi:hypothetical protein
MTGTMSGARSPEPVLQARKRLFQSVQAPFEHVDARGKRIGLGMRRARRG